VSPIATFVVDDEALGRERLGSLLRDDPEISVVGSFGSASEAVSHATALAPRLVFLDVRMPEQDGFQLVESLSQEGINPYIVFVTAYSDRPMDAFSIGAVDYILKPFDKPRFSRALERAKQLISSGAAPPAQARPVVPAVQSRARLLLSERGKVVMLSIHDIEFIQAASKHVKIYAGGRCYWHRQSLSDLEASLDPAYFVRIHRSTLLNIEHIAEMHALFHGDYEIITRRGTHLTLSRRYRDRLAPFLMG
jgi:two-component system LytT family response regulator